MLLVLELSNITATTMGGESKPHFVLVPLMAQGHVIPMVDMARLLVEHGAVATVIITPINAARISSTIQHAHQSGLPLRFAELRFPCDEVGLRQGCENLDLITSVDEGRKFFDAAALLQEKLKAYIQEQQLLPQPPSCVVFDACTPWASQVARELNIHRMVFHGYSAFSLLCLNNIRRHNLYEEVSNEDEPFLVPDFPHDVRIEVTKATAPMMFGASGWEKLRDDVIKAEMTADGLILNSFNELESSYIKRLEEVLGTKTWVMGPFLLCSKDAASNVTRGDKAAVEESQCLSWLDSMETRSVIYVSFGSMAHTPPAQLIEIGAGLEESGVPFIWVIKNREMSPEVEQWLAEEYEERVRSRSLIIKGWAPQVPILSHPAIGGFMTHCGWNSVLEAVSAGVPMLTWPHFADQFLNEKLVVDVLKVGVQMGIKSPVMAVAEKNPVVIKREEIETTVRRLMDRGEEAEGRRRVMKELRCKAGKAMEEGGSSYANTKLLIQHIMHHEKHV